MTSFALTLGRLQADKLIKPTYSQTYGLTNGLILTPKVSVDYTFDRIYKENEKK